MMSQHLVTFLLGLLATVVTGRSTGYNYGSDQWESCPAGYTLTQDAECVIARPYQPVSPYRSCSIICSRLLWPSSLQMQSSGDSPCDMDEVPVVSDAEALKYAAQALGGNVRQSLPNQY